MKNLFLTSAFMLLGTVAFASTNTSKNVESIEATNKYTEKADDGSIHLRLSCGIEGELSWTGNPSAADVIEVSRILDDILC